MPRLLILCEYPTLLGGERSMLATLPTVSAAGFEIHIAAPPNGPLAVTLRERSIAHVSWPTPNDRADLAHIIRCTQPELLHANSLSTARISGPVAAELRVPSIGHLRDIVKLTRRAIADVNLHRRIVAVSHATRDFHLAQGLDAQRSTVLYNGVDLEIFRPRPGTGYVHDELQLPDTVQFIATIGQLGLRKATEVALRAARDVADELPNLHWLIIGERTSDKAESIAFERKLHELAETPPLAGRVHFLGSRADVPSILNECALLVHAARQEPLGRVLLEAAAGGLATIATNVGGTREIFPADSHAAILIPADDPAAIADGLRALCQDEDCRRALATAARRRAEEAFDIRLTAARLVAEYQRALN